MLLHRQNSSFVFSSRQVDCPVRHKPEQEAKFEAGGCKHRAKCKRLLRSNRLIQAKPPCWECRRKIKILTGDLLTSSPFKTKINPSKIHPVGEWKRKKSERKKKKKKKKAPAIRPLQRHSHQVSILERDAGCYRHHRVADVPQGSDSIISRSVREKAGQLFSFSVRQREDGAERRCTFDELK